MPYALGPKLRLSLLGLAQAVEPRSLAALAPEELEECGAL